MVLFDKYLMTGYLDYDIYEYADVDVQSVNDQGSPNFVEEIAHLNNDKTYFLLARQSLQCAQPRASPKGDD